jgi:signal transduction histidine kinase
MTQTNGKAAQSMRKQLLVMFVLCTALGGAIGALGSTAPWLAACIAVAGAPTMWWLTRQCLRPVQRLAHTVAGRQPQETTPLGHTPAIELEPIVRALNVQWQQQRDALEQQQRFIAEASHQLRTPLAVLKTQVQGVTSGELPASDTLPKMLRTLDRATDLANQLLSQAKVEQKVRHAQWNLVDMHHLASEVLVEFAPLIARKQLEVSLDAEPVRLMSDSWLAGELLRNLLANAIRQSANGASLGVVIRHLPAEMELLVWDNAGGLDEAVRERLFQPFESASGGTGVGLGLSICKQIAVSMHATLDLYNRIQQGAVVGVDAVVRWPLPDQASPQQSAAPARSIPQAALSEATLRMPA